DDRRRVRPMLRRALASCAAVALAVGFAVVVTPVPAGAEPVESCTPGFTSCVFVTPATSPATRDAFVASFTHGSAVTVQSITFSLSGTPAGCDEPAPVVDTNPTTVSDPESPAVSTTTSNQISFGFDCNGVYTIQATANTPNCGGPFPGQRCPYAKWYSLQVAVPAPDVKDLTTSVDSGGAVTVAWKSGYAGAPPHDFRGYQLNRIDGSGNSVSLPIAPDATSYQDVDVPASGTYVYEVVSQRAGAADTHTRSQPTVVLLPSASTTPSSTVVPGTPTTAGTPAVTSSRSVRPQPGGAPMFDPTTLADDSEPGDPLAEGPNAPGVAAIKLDDGRGGTPGAGLVKPFAAALAASV